MPGEQTFAFAGEKGQKGKAGRNPLSYHETKHSGPVTGAKEKTVLPVISLEEKKKSHLAYANAVPGSDFLD